MGKPNRSRLLVPDHILPAMEITRFWSNVGDTDESGCRPWLGDSYDGGYGLYTWRGRRFPAHELALTFTTGEVRSEGLETCHSCNNPPCCNPEHLRFDTHQANVDDMTSAGRHARGDQNGRRKLCSEQVEQMRRRRANGARVKDLAEHYGVTPAMVSEICRGLRWRSAGGPIVKSAGTGPNPKNRRASWPLETH